MHRPRILSCVPFGPYPLPDLQHPVSYNRQLKSPLVTQESNVLYLLGTFFMLNMLTGNMQLILQSIFDHCTQHNIFILTNNILFTLAMANSLSVCVV